MMYSSLPQLVQLAFLIAGFFVLSVLTFILLFMVSNRKPDSRMVHTLIHNLLLALSVYLMFVSYVSNEKPETRGFYKNIPWMVHLAIILYETLRSIVGSYHLIKFGPKRFSRNAIKVSFENLPIGLCFSGKDGSIYLANYKMYSESFNLLGYREANMVTFWKELEDYKPVNGIRKLDSSQSNPTQISFSMPNGRVLQVNRELIALDNGDEYLQTSIADVTVQYDLYEQITKDNEALIRQRQELKELVERTIQSNHAEEVLNHKIRIHNDMGQLILETKQRLGSVGTVEEYREIALRWQDISRKFYDISSQKSADAHTMLDEIIDIANQIGCEVSINRAIPENLVEMSLIRQAIREAVMNAVKHGQAAKVDIIYEDEGGNHRLILQNDGVCTGAVNPAGGLKNIAEGLRPLGGNLQIKQDGLFQLIITLPKGTE